MSGEDETTDKVIELDALPALRKLLDHEKHGIRKEACWSLSNVLAGTPQQIQKVMDEGDIIPIILHLLATDRFDVKKEAAWCIANAVSGATAIQIISFVQQNCIPALCSLLKIQDNKLLDMTLDALRRTLKVGKKIQTSRNLARNPFAEQMYSCGGVDILENDLQHSNNEEIYNKTQEIIISYFKTVDDDSTNNINQSEYEFNVAQQTTPYQL